MSNETHDELLETIDKVRFLSNRKWMEHGNEVQALRDEIEQLTNALRFYADGSKYHHRNAGMMGSIVPASLKPCQISSDAGQIARAALSLQTKDKGQDQNNA